MKNEIWMSCTGCFETGDYGEGQNWYPYDEEKDCRIGSGCHECGGAGVVRDRLSEAFQEDIENIGLEQAVKNMWGEDDF